MEPWPRGAATPASPKSHWRSMPSKAPTPKAPCPTSSKPAVP